MMEEKDRMVKEGKWDGRKSLDDLVKVTIPKALDLPKDCANVSYVNLKGLTPNKGVEAMVKDEIDTDSSILWKSSMSTDFVDIEFDEVLKKNRVLKGFDIDDFSDAFETLYDECFCQEKVEMLNAFTQRHHKRDVRLQSGWRAGVCWRSSVLLVVIWAGLEGSKSGGNELELFLE